jgi:hypothetical protein
VCAAHDNASNVFGVHVVFEQIVDQYARRNKLHPTAHIQGFAEN